MVVAGERGKLILSAPARLAFAVRSAGATTDFFPSVKFPRQARNVRLVAAAGPTTANYVFALVFPLSLLAVTIIVSATIGDKLDQKYMEELAINQAIEEADIDEDTGDPDNETPVTTRMRKRQA